LILYLGLLEGGCGVGVGAAVKLNGMTKDVGPPIDDGWDMEFPTSMTVLYIPVPLVLHPSHSVEQ
jgi:hypothetical protein